MKKILLLLSLSLSIETMAQELIFEKRPLILGEYVRKMALPIIAFELFAEGETDKKRHFEAGYLTAAVSGYFLRKHTDNLAVQIIGTVLSGYLITYAKEGADLYLGTGTYSKADIRAGCWGSNVAMFSYMFTVRHDVKEIKKFN